MTSEFEQSHNANDAKELKDVVASGTAVQIGEYAIQHERSSSHNVENVERSADKVHFGRTESQSNKQLRNEPHVAYTLDVEEGVVWLGFVFNETGYHHCFVSTHQCHSVVHSVVC